MTIVTSRREVKPSQARVVAARKSNASVASSPRLARGREELKLVRSRSSTPPGHGGIRSAAEHGTARESMELDFTDQPSSPTVSQSTRTTAFSRGYTPTPSVSNVSFDSPGPSTQSWRGRAYSESQFSEATDVTEDRASDIATTSTVPAGPSRPFTLQASGHSFNPSGASEEDDVRPASPSTRSAPPAARSDVWNDKRPLPIAPWPPGQPREFAHTASKNKQPGDTKRKGIKTPYDTQEKKAKVKAVRDSGACMRCIIFRQACEVLTEGQSCGACQVTSRKWHIPCTKMWLKDRWVYLLPDAFLDQLELRNQYAFPRIEPANRSPPFKLRLVKDHGLELEIWVYAVVGKDLDLSMFQKIVLMPETVQPVGEPSLPLMAEHRSATITEIEHRIGEHMYKLSRYPEQRDLPEIIFPEDEGLPWARDVFTMVCRYQESVVQGQSRAIGLALKTFYVRILMGRTFFVPKDEIDCMNRQLPEEYRLASEVLAALKSEDYSLCPKYVDRFIKAALLKSLKTALLPKCFAELEGLFRLMDKDHGKAKLSEWSRDEAFCATVVVLLLAGYIQVKIAEGVSARLAINWNNVTTTEGGREKLHEEAIKSIYVIEREIVDHLLNLFAYQFSKEKMVGQTSPHESRAGRVSATWKPIGEFQNSHAFHADSIARINPELDLHNMTGNEFARDNLSRILLRLNEKLWRPKDRKR